MNCTAVEVKEREELEQATCTFNQVLYLSTILRDLYFISMFHYSVLLLLYSKWCTFPPLHVFNPFSYFTDVDE